LVVRVRIWELMALYVCRSCLLTITVLGNRHEVERIIVRLTFDYYVYARLYDLVGGYGCLYRYIVIEIPHNLLTVVVI
jgi:hypothetical protein